MSDTVDCCPRCQKGPAYLKRYNNRNGNRKTTSKWRCIACRHEFDVPDERERRNPSNITRGLAKTLSEMDASDVGGNNE